MLLLLFRGGKGEATAQAAVAISAGSNFKTGLGILSSRNILTAGQGQAQCCCPCSGEARASLEAPALWDPAQFEAPANWKHLPCADPAQRRAVVEYPILILCCFLTLTPSVGSQFLFMLVWKEKGV